MPRFFKKCSGTFQKRLGTISKMFRNISKIVPQYFQKSSGTFLYCSRTLRQFSKVFLFQKCSGNISKVFQNILKSVMEHSKLLEHFQKCAPEHCHKCFKILFRNIKKIFKKCSGIFSKVFRNNS